MKQRPDGHATVEEHPKGSGRFRVRARVKGKLKTILSGVSRAEADESADAFAQLRHADSLREGITLLGFGPGFLDRRERDGSRNGRTERNAWKNHVEKDPIANIPIATLERRDVLEWRDRRPRDVGTRKNLLNLLRVALHDALDRGLCKFNPARDVRVKGKGKVDLDDLTGILAPVEQRRLLAVVPAHERALVAFALMTGLRQAEQWWLKPEDLGRGLIVVRRSKDGKPPKGNKVRTVHLLAPAARALELAPSNADWVWPAERGGRRPEGKPPKDWHRWVKRAKIRRRIRWHDLRHTCATSLLAGWWGGRKWTLDEVCKHLGHSSVKVTERYARKLAETHRLAVNETVFPRSSPLMLPQNMKMAEKKRSRLRDLNSRPAVYETAGLSSKSGRLLGGVFPRGNVETFPGGWALALAAERVLRVVPVASIRRRSRKGVA